MIRFTVRNSRMAIVTALCVLVMAAVSSLTRNAQELHDVTDFEPRNSYAGERAPGEARGALHLPHSARGRLRQPHPAG